MSELELLAGDRQNGETDNAVIACNDYLRMGPARSQGKLLERYQTVTASPPTRRLATIKDWSVNFGWVSRATAYDAAAEDVKTEVRDQVMATGLALDYERVVKLKDLAAFLVGQIYEQGEDGVYHNVWVPDVKIVGRGEYAEVVDIERFNSSLLREFRETLADIAAEVGGRVNKHEVQGVGSVVVKWPEQEDGND